MDALDRRERKTLSFVLGALVSVAVVAAETAVGWAFFDRRVADVAMLFLLGVVLTSVVFGYTASLTTTVLSVAALDFFFTVPYFSFTVNDPRDYLTFVILGLVAYVISSQTARIRREASERTRLATERVRLAAEADRAELEIQNERTRNALLSTVSHDLRAPLAVIQAAASGLLQASPTLLGSARGREHLSAIADEAEHLGRLLQNLMDMTALEAGPVRVRKEWQPLEEVIGVALRRLESQLAGRPVDVRIAPDAEHAAFDATLLEQVFVNLLENAAKYTPPRSRITISTARVPGGIEVEVGDDGPGVPGGEEEAIFQKFHRATRQGVGMGVGLAICRGVLTAHDGWIRYASRPEGGASFRFFLPGKRPLELPPVETDAAGGYLDTAT
jgi:K+-sensing histidine kinase KdpD